MNKQFRQHQQGAVLVVAIIFLMLTALISTTVLKTSILEIKMVGNAQFKEEAFQKSEGVIHAITSNYTANLPISGGIGYKVCATGSTDNSCNAKTISLTSSVTDVASGVNLAYTAERIGPLLAPLPFRESADRASGAGSFNVARFEIDVEYDGRSAKLGHHRVTQGIAVKLAASSQ